MGIVGAIGTGVLNGPENLRRQHQLIRLATLRCLIGKKKHRDDRTHEQPKLARLRLSFRHEPPKRGQFWRSLLRRLLKVRGRHVGIDGLLHKSKRVLQNGSVFRRARGKQRARSQVLIESVWDRANRATRWTRALFAPRQRYRPTFSNGKHVCDKKDRAASGIGADCWN